MNVLDSLAHPSRLLCDWLVCPQKSIESVFSNLKYNCPRCLQLAAGHKAWKALRLPPKVRKFLHNVRPLQRVQTVMRLLLLTSAILGFVSAELDTLHYLHLPSSSGSPPSLVVFGDSYSGQSLLPSSLFCGRHGWLRLARKYSIRERNKRTRMPKFSQFSKPILCRHWAHCRLLVHIRLLKLDSAGLEILTGNSFLCQHFWKSTPIHY